MEKIRKQLIDIVSMAEHIKNCLGYVNRKLKYEEVDSGLLMQNMALCTSLLTNTMQQINIIEGEIEKREQIVAYEKERKKKELSEIKNKKK